MNYYIMVNGKGLVESVGHMGITYTTDTNKAFAYPNKWAANDCMKLFEPGQAMMFREV